MQTRVGIRAIGPVEDLDDAPATVGGAHEGDPPSGLGAASRCDKAKTFTQKAIVRLPVLRPPRDDEVEDVPGPGPLLVDKRRVAGAGEVADAEAHAAWQA